MIIVVGFLRRGGFATLAQELYIIANFRGLEGQGMGGHYGFVECLSLSSIRYTCNGNNSLFRLLLSLFITGLRSVIDESQLWLFILRNVLFDSLFM